MPLSGTFSWLNRRNAPNAVTSSGPSQPQSALPGMGGTIRARSLDGWSLVAARCAVVREAIIGHMVLARAGTAGAGLPRIGVADATRAGPGTGLRDIAWC